MLDAVETESEKTQSFTYLYNMQLRCVQKLFIFNLYDNIISTILFIFLKKYLYIYYSMYKKLIISVQMLLSPYKGDILMTTAFFKTSDCCSVLTGPET